MRVLQVIFATGINLIPIIGVFVWGWSPFDIFFYFWVETVLTCLFYAGRLLVCGIRANLGSIISFLATTGIMLSLFLLFITALFGPSQLNIIELFYFIAHAFLSGAWYIAYLCITKLITHLYYYTAYTPPRPDFMKSFSQSPYAKIAVLYTAVFFGGFAAARFHLTLMPLFLMVGTSIYIDYLGTRTSAYTS